MSWDWIAALAECRERRRPAVLLTVVKTQGSAPREAGARLLAFPDGSFQGSVGGGRLEALALADAATCLREGKPRLARYVLGASSGQCCGGAVEILLEPLHAGPRLYLFGAGHVGRAVCEVLEGTPFLVSVVDERAEWALSPELPPSVLRRHAPPLSFIEQADWDAERAYAAVMTHSHARDLAVLASLLRRPARYIGLIGSRGKWENFQRRLKALGFSPEEIARVRCPLGLPTGGKSPKEIAVSLAAELLRLHHGLPEGAPAETEENEPAREECGAPGADAAWARAESR